MTQFDGRDRHNQGNRSHRNDRRNDFDRQQPQVSVPPFDDTELLGEKAHRLAKDIAQGTQLSATQIRNFYSEVKNIERVVDANEDAWGECYNRIKLIKAKVIYNKNRDRNAQRSFGPFAEFIGQSIDRITSDEAGIKNFKIFCQLFEAVVGYSSQYANKQ